MIRRQGVDLLVNSRLYTPQDMATLVMKFGGSLASDAKSIARLAQVIMAEALAWKRLTVIISAMAGATNTLNGAADSAAAGDARSYRKFVASLREQHVAVIDALFDDEAQRSFLTSQIDRLLFDVLTVCDTILPKREASGRERDLILAVGERMLMHVLTALLCQEGLRAVGIDSASLIVTDDRHQNANPQIDLIDERADRILRPLLDAEIVPIVTGFIGATKNGVVTTLGRGGSDYSATLLASAVHADEVWIWTHVDGVMSADPALVPGARVIPALSYAEVGELSFFGARVLHPRAVDPLLTKRIPLRVRNPFNLDHAGTLIQAETEETDTPFKAVTAADGVCLSRDGQPIDLTELLGQVHRIAGRSAAGPVAVMQSHLRSTLVFVVPTSEGTNAVAMLCQRLRTAFEPGRWEITPVKVIAAMGAVNQSAAFPTIEGVHPIATVSGPGERRLLVVSPAETQMVVRQLHKLIESGSGQMYARSGFSGLLR